MMLMDKPTYYIILHVSNIANISRALGVIICVYFFISKYCLIPSALCPPSAHLSHLYEYIKYFIGTSTGAHECYILIYSLALLYNSLP